MTATLLAVGALPLAVRAVQLARLRARDYLFPLPPHPFANDTFAALAEESRHMRVKS